MKLRGTLTFEYELPEVDHKAIVDSEENGDPTDDFFEEAETDFYNNKPQEYLRQRLLAGLVDPHEIDEKLEEVSNLRIEVVEH
jgi:hypothetical protein